MKVLSVVLTVILLSNVGAVRATVGTDNTGAAPVLPPVSLAGLPGLDEDRAYAKSVARRAAELAEQARRTEDESTRIDLLLRTANLILAREIEPVCTITLLRLNESSRHEQDAAVSDAIDRAAALLNETAALLDGRVVAPGDEAQPERPWAPKRRLEVLRAFTAALRAYLPSRDDADGVRAARQAASRLSVLLEEENQQIAAAAGLWQACLRSRDADPSRALVLLDPALADLPRNSLPFSLFARLFRCRLMAAQGAYATALALLTQMEERLLEWITDEAEQGDALRAVALFQIQILRDWHGTLTEPNRAEERQWCIDRAERIATNHFSEERHSVLRLDPCVPLLTTPPPAPNQDSGDSPDED